MQYIILNHDLGELIITINTWNEIAEAKRLMKKFGVVQADVWSGDVGKDSKKTGLKLFTD